MQRPRSLEQGRSPTRCCHRCYSGRHSCSAGNHLMGHLACHRYLERGRCQRFVEVCANSPRCGCFYWWRRHRNVGYPPRRWGTCVYSAEGVRRGLGRENTAPTAGQAATPQAQYVQVILDVDEVRWEPPYAAIARPAFPPTRRILAKHQHHLPLVERQFRVFCGRVVGQRSYIAAKQPHS